MICYHLYSPWFRDFNYSLSISNFIKVKRMRKSGTEAIRTQIKPSKPKREITKITHSQNTKRTYGHPSEQLFPKRLPLSNPNRTKNNMNTRKVKRHRNSDTKTIAKEVHRSISNIKMIKRVQNALVTDGQ